MTAACPSRRSRYVPGSFGEMFKCVACGRLLRQDHLTAPIECPSGVRDYDTIYPFPAHPRKTRRS